MHKIELYYRNTRARTYTLYKTQILQPGIDELETLIIKTYKLLSEQKKLKYASIIDKHTYSLYKE